MKINNAEDIETAKLTFAATDQTDELEIGCEIWDVTFKVGENWMSGVMSRWPNDRGAFECGGDSYWGDWENDTFLKLDSYGEDGTMAWVDCYGENWCEVVVDFEYSADSFWEELREQNAELVARFGNPMTTKGVRVHEDELEAMKRVLGWDGGPEHAPNPVFLI